MASLVPELPVLARDQAFEDLYRRYVKDVYHYALALLRNPADAEDVTQTTFMNAYGAYKRGDEILKPHNWLIKIAHNVARTRYARASRRVKEVPLEEHVDQLAVSDDERTDIEGVLRALGRLPFNQRSALVLRELEGRSYAEIADTLQVSVPAVETLIFRARKALRMRASSLRVITTIPLPGSLTHLVQGGTLVAGGGAGAGAAVGTGVLAKVAVVVIAGAFATSVGGDRAGSAEAAARGETAVAPASTASTGSAAGSAKSPAGGRVRADVGTTFGAGQAANGATPAAFDPSAPSSTGAPATSPGTATPTSTVKDAAKGTVAKVEETAATLPVQIPSVPSVPAVTVPALPVPALPVPTVPAVTVPVPPLPPPPKLP